jgi:hypothetical protein
MITTRLSTRTLGLVLLTVLAALFVSPGKVHAQRDSLPAVAQVGAGTPLPVFVINDLAPGLPAGFVSGTSWRFTTWTVPSNLSFIVTVQKTVGGWAFLKTTTDSKSRWYYVPQMPGSWEQQ